MSSLLLAVLAGYPLSVYAEARASLSNSRIREILNQFSLEQNSPVSNVLRQIGWQVVVWLHWLVGELENVIYGINNAIGGFFTSDAIKKLEQEKIIPLAILLLGVVILWIGIRSIVKPQQFTTITSNFIVGVTVAIALPTLLSAGYQFTNQAITFLNDGSDGKALGVSDRILIDNITDNTLYDENGFSTKDLKYRNSYARPGADASQITKIDAAELVYPDKMKYQDVWKNKLTVDSTGKQSITQVGSGQVAFINIPLMSEYYYRWNIDWFNILTTLIVTAVALLFSGVKIARLVYELTLHQVLAQVLGLLDVFTAQRMKKCIQSIVATLGTLFAIFFMLQVYILGTAYISKVDNVFLRLVLMIALAWSVIDGPNLFEQIFGIDAGLHGALRTMYGLKAAGNVVAGGVALAGGRGLLDSLKTKGVVGTAKAVAGKAGSVVGGAGGFAAGKISGAVDNHRRVAAVKDSFSGGHTAESKSPSPAHIAPGFSAPAETVPTAAENTISDVQHSEREQSQVPDVTASASAGSASPSVEKGFAASSFSPPAASAAASGPQEGSAHKTAGTAATLGGAIRSGISRRVSQSGAVRSAQRVYSLTRNSSAARGDRKVAFQERAIPKEQNGMNHRQAVREAKYEIRQESKADSGKDWAAEEFGKEKSTRKEEVKGHDIPNPKAAERRI